MSQSSTVERVTQSCARCGADFAVDTSERCWWSKKYCSDECRESHQKTVRDEKRAVLLVRDVIAAPSGVRGGRFVDIVCEYCGTRRTVPYELRERRFCPKPATCCYDIQKKPKPVLTDEQRLANEMLRRQRSAAGRRGQKRTPEQRAKFSEALRESWAKGNYADANMAKTPEHRAVLAERTLQAYKDGRLDPTGCYRNKWVVYRSPGRTINMRSKSEALFAHHLDSLGMEWEYEPERFDLGWSTYTPDFYLPEFDHWVEVKGWWTDTSRRKFDEFALSHSASVVRAKALLNGVDLAALEIMKGVE